MKARLWIPLWSLSIVTFNIGSGVSSEPIHLLVPAYANPCCADGPEMWEKLIRTAGNRSRHFHLAIIFNPASGPGTKRDPNYLSTDGQTGVLKTIRDNGAKIFGYVATGYGKRNPKEIEHDIDGYLRNPQLYQGHVDGIFFDEVSSDLADVPRYRPLVEYAKSIVNACPTIGNPGIAATQNASGQTGLTPNDYAKTFDLLVTFENSADVYLNRYAAPAYLADTIHVIHSQPTWDRQWIDTAKERGAKYLFITDDVHRGTGDNPYDRLPSYWEKLVDDVNLANR